MKQYILNELVDGIIKILNKKVNRIILYGSVAKGTNTEESDVDIAMLIAGDLSEKLEDSLSDFIVDMNLKYDKVFSVIDINIDDFNKWEKTIPFYRNVNEGVILWKAA